MNDFKKINFGYASAEKESSKAPDLLVNGFVDFDDAFRKAMESDEYLFLGYKGAGKTAIAKRMDIEATGSHSVFNNNILIGDFPFVSLSKIVRGSAEAEAKIPTAWAWLLLLYVYRSLDRDAALKHSDPIAWQSSISALRSEGLLSGDDMTSLVKKTSKKGFKVSIAKLGSYERSSETSPLETDVSIYVDTMKELLEGAVTPNRHYVTIDGFDDIVTKRAIKLTSIGSLIFEVGRLNEMFRKKGANIKIILLCRTDIFEKVTNANKNKARQDYSVELDWYHDPREPHRSKLVEISNTRAALALKRPVSIFTEFIPQEIDRNSAANVLLDMTRHTPRDFLQLLSHIQRFVVSAPITDAHIKSGMRDYSIKYFLPELRDELDGYCSAEEVQAFIRSTSRLKKREFSHIEIVSEMRDEGVSPERTGILLEALYECSGIGNVSTRIGGKSFFAFKFRNRNSVFNKNDRILLHKGVWKALNVT